MIFEKRNSLEEFSNESVLNTDIIQWLKSANPQHDFACAPQPSVSFDRIPTCLTDEECLIILNSAYEMYYDQIFPNENKYFIIDEITPFNVELKKMSKTQYLIIEKYLAYAMHILAIRSTISERMMKQSVFAQIWKDGIKLHLKYSEEQDLRSSYLLPTNYNIVHILKENNNLQQKIKEQERQVKSLQFKLSCAGDPFFSTPSPLPEKYNSDIYIEKWENLRVKGILDRNYQPKEHYDGKIISKPVLMYIALKFNDLSHKDNLEYNKDWSSFEKFWGKKGFANEYKDYHDTGKTIPLSKIIDECFPELMPPKIKKFI